MSINRAAAARYGLNVADVQAVVSGAIGGEAVGQTVEGLARYPISVRYPREIRDSVDDIINLPVLTPSRQQITLGTVADVRISKGPPMLRSENGRPAKWVYIDGRGRTLTEIVGDLQRAVAQKVKLSFKAGEPNWNLSGMGELERMPAVQFKLANIRKIKAANPAKHATTFETLREHLSK